MSIFKPDTNPSAITVFNQHIDPSGVQFESTPGFIMTIGVLGFFVVIAISTAVILAGIRRDEKGKANPALFAICCIIPLLLIGGYIVGFPSHHPIISPWKKPVFAETVTEEDTWSVKNPDKKSIPDTYRDEINTAIADKFSDYDISDRGRTDSRESILDGGYNQTAVIASRDGQTYTLVPEWDYDSSESTVALTVRVKDGYHPYN